MNLLVFPLLETVGLVSIGMIDNVSIICNIVCMDKIDDRQYEEAARLLRVLGHPVRLAMVEVLSKRPWCVCELADSLGLNKSATSKHLSLLKSVGVIDMERTGTQVNCTLVMSCVLDMMHCACPGDVSSRQPVPTDGASAPDDFEATIDSCIACCRTQEKNKS